MKSLLLSYLLAFFSVGLPAVTYAQTTPKTVVGDVAVNLLELPPWTMRQCPKDFFATYDLEGAKLLKMRDNDCHLWRVKQAHQADIIKAQVLSLQKLQTANQLADDMHKVSTEHIRFLTDRLKEEISLKNEFKYKPNYNWLYISIGAAVALAGVAFGVGVWVAKDNS